jgi:hypothetical protein
MDHGPGICQDTRAVYLNRSQYRRIKCRSLKVQLSYDITFEASNLSPAELAQLMILITKCQIYRTTLEQVGKDYVYAGYLKDIELTMSRADVEHVTQITKPPQASLPQRLPALAADAAALLMSEPEKV